MARALFRVYRRDGKLVRDDNMRTPRWQINRLVYNHDNEVLQHVKVYAVGENKELVKRENRNVRHKRKLLLIDAQ